jgi:hypothetical protein
VEGRDAVLAGRDAVLVGMDAVLAGRNAVLAGRHLVVELELLWRQAAHLAAALEVVPVGVQCQAGGGW